MRFDIDMRFSVTQPGSSDNAPGPVHGTIKASGNTITVTTDSLSILPSARSIDWPSLKHLARKLKHAGVTVDFVGPAGSIISLGNVKPSLFSRIGTNSSAIRVGRVGSAGTLLRRASGSPEAPSLRVASTPLPLLPTFLKKYRRKPTTTHYTHGGGHPRIIFVKDSDSWDGKAPKILNVMQEVIEIGSAPEAGLVLADLEPVHARIVHNELDEYVLVAVGPVGGSAGLGPGGEYTLRSGARMELGPWRLVFYREEYADHGRPFGGRNGGELSFQKPQYNPRTGLIELDSSE